MEFRRMPVPARCHRLLVGCPVARGALPHRVPPSPGSPKEPTPKRAPSCLVWPICSKLTSSVRTMLGYFGCPSTDVPGIVAEDVDKSGRLRCLARTHEPTHDIHPFCPRDGNSVPGRPRDPAKYHSSSVPMSCQWFPRTSPHDGKRRDDENCKLTDLAPKPKTFNTTSSVRFRKKIENRAAEELCFRDPGRGADASRVEDLADSD